MRMKVSVGVRRREYTSEREEELEASVDARRRGSNGGVRFLAHRIEGKMLRRVLTLFFPLSLRV